MKDPPEHGSAAIIIRGARLLTNPEHKVLKALVSWYDFLGFHYVDFRTLSRQTKMRRRIVRLVCRALARKGLAEYSNGLFNDDGRVAGAGYAATAEGKVVCEVKTDGGKQDLSYGSQRKAATARRRLHISD